MHRPLLQIVLAVLLPAVVAGCGFHPRNSLALADDLGPVKVVTADPYSPLAYGLATALDRAGATAAVEGQPSATLQVRSERLDIRPLSVDARAQVREYELRYFVKFELLDAEGKPRIPLQDIVLSREYVYDSLSPSGSPAEQELLKSELRRDMQAAILRRMDVVLRKR